MILVIVIVVALAVVAAAVVVVFKMFLATQEAKFSSKEVYAACAPRPLDGENATAKMVESLGSGNPEKIAAALMNDLQAPAVKLHPEIADALVSLRTAGVVGAMMSGSGSSVFGLVENEADARRISSEMNARGYKAWPVQTL